nr:hypothetical protein [uncultured Cellulosilyticum sp.]
MVHTLEFYVNITHVEKELVERKHGQHIKGVIRKLERQFSKFNIRIGKPMWNGSYNIYLQFDAVELLGRTEDGEIVPDDYELIQFHILELEHQLFDFPDRHFILNRIDYRVDLKVENKEHRKILFKLWRKIAKSYGHLKKRTKKNATREQKDGKEIYRSEKSYQTTIYLASKSLVVCLYDKEEERRSKGMEPLPYERNVIRFEVRLMRNHLAYKAREEKVYKDKNKKKKETRERSLEAYMEKRCFDEYIKKYIVTIFGTEDFHKLDVIKSKLIEAEIKNAQRDKLINFINIIARAGVEGVINYRGTKSKKKGSCSRYTMKRYRQILSELDIHIISLPLKTKGVGNILENPLGKWKMNNE